VKAKDVSASTQALRLLNMTIRNSDPANPEQCLIELTDPQYRLVMSERQFPAMVAGFGAGKTNALMKRALRLKLGYPENNIAYYLPTYDLVRTIAFPRFQEELEAIGYYEKEHYSLVQSLTPMIKIFDGGQIIFRTMDNPGRIVGYEVADSFIDELDTLKQDDARTAWQKIIARNRQKKPDGSKNTIAVGTTPEGFKFVYERWKQKPPSPEYELIKASTYSNARNLPSDYIDNLLDDYPSNLIAAYLEGEFVNLIAGAVYPEYDRTLNGSSEVIKAGEHLHIGMDFNVGKMSGIIFVQRGGDPHAVNELMGLLDTPAMILAIKRKFPNHAIFVYPDASGNARKSNNASESDLALLRQAGFNVMVNSKNPFVKDRVLAMNRMIHAGGRRRLRVNADLCPAFAEGLEKQAYDKNGEPDKTSGFDHGNDAGGYFVNFRFPVVSGRVIKTKIGGV
jgi:hypothetical protein